MKNITVNFGGFYNSVHSDIIELIDNEYEIDFENVDFVETHKSYSKGYISVLNNMLDTNFKFIELDLPKFYNYNTDTIVISASKSDFLKCLKFIKDEGLTNEVYQNIISVTKRVDGYIPFYTYEEVFKKENRNLLLECILTTICDNFEDTVINGIVSNYLEIIEKDN